MTLSSNTLRAVVCAVIVITAIPAGIVSLSTEVTAQSGSSDVSISNAFIQDGTFVDLTEGEPVDVVVDGTVETGVGVCYDHRIEIRVTGLGLLGRSSETIKKHSFSPDDESFRAEVPVTIPTDDPVEVGEENEFEAKLIQENTCSVLSGKKTATSSTLTHFVKQADSSDPDPEIVDEVNEIPATYIRVNEQSDIPGASPVTGNEDIDNPPTVAVGQEITVALQVVNEGGDAGEFSGVQIQLKSIDSQSKTDAIERTGLGTAIQPGDEVFPKGGDGDTRDATSWQIDRVFDSHVPGPLATSVTVTPQETGEFVILMRGTYTDDQEQAGVENKFTTAGSAEDPDQDYTMRRVVVEVINDTDDDGILNQNDEAPNEPEDDDGYQDSDGDPENPSPTVSLAGMSVTEGQQQTLSADASDPEEKSLNYEWSLNGPGQLTGSGEEVVYKAPSSPDGITRGRTADVTVTVTTTGETRGQSEKSATATAQVGLEDINPPPSVSLPDQSVKEGNKVTLTADATNPEDDGISYQWSKDGPGSLSSSGETATYTAPSDISESVSTSVSVTVTEPQGRSASASATVSVKNNRGDDDTDGDGILNQNDEAPNEPEDKDGYQDNDGDPENPPPTVSLAGMSVTEGQQQTLSADANDPEGKSLNYEWSLNGPGRLTGNGGEVVYKAPSSPDGITRGRTADVTVTVTTTGETRGQSEKSATATAQVDLEDVNPTPSVSLPDKQLSEGGTITIRASANNPEDDGISYQWSKDGPGSLSSSGETATYTAPSDISESVSTSVSVTVTEPQGRSASASATVSVKNNQGDDDTDGDGILNQNDEAPNEPEDKDGYQDSDGDPENPPPTVSLTGISVTEGQQQTLSADASDPEGDSLNYEWVLSGAGKLSTTSGQSITYTAPSDISLDKSATVSVTVTEPDSGKSSQAEATISIPDNPDPAQFDIAISNTNNPPAGEELEVTAEITNTGEQTGQATVQLDTTAGEIEPTQTTVNLGGGDSTTETLTVDTTGVDPGSYTATVSAGDTASEKQFTIVENPDPAQFAVEITDINNPPAGEQLEVTAEITNTGDQTGQPTVQLDTTAGEIEGTQTTVDLAGGESTTEPLTVDTTGVDAGSYTATVTASAATGTGTDENPGDAASFEIAAAPAEFQLEFSEVPTQIITGESYSPTVEVTNNGAGAGTQDISYVLENPDGLSTGIEAVEPSVELAAGESEQITFDFEAQETDALSTGTYNHVFKSADDESVREVELEAGFSIAQFDRNDTGQIEFDDLRYATREYNRENITFDQLRRVLRAYNTDQQV